MTIVPAVLKDMLISGPETRSNFHLVRHARHSASIDRARTTQPSCERCCRQRASLLW